MFEEKDDPYTDQQNPYIRPQNPEKISQSMTSNKKHNKKEALAQILSKQ